MEKAISLAITVLTFLSLISLHKALESPNFTVVHSESDFQIRLYTDSRWMTAPVNDNSFQTATRNGFNRLFQYIQGANAKSSSAPMTKPVLTSINSSVPQDVRFYMPAKFQPEPPVPEAELNLKADTWTSRCVATRKFSGYATDSNVVEEAKKLGASLSKFKWGKSASSESETTYLIAQYNSPFRLFGRVNEVWVDVGDCSKPGSS